MDNKPSTKIQGRTHGQDTSSYDVDWDSDDEPQKTSLCCLQGCISATAVGVSFFLGLPTGIILVVQALNNDGDTTLLAIGIVLIILPFIILTVVIILCLNQNRLPNLVFCKKRKPKPVAPKSVNSNCPEPTTKSNGHINGDGNKNSRHKHPNHNNNNNNDDHIDRHNSSRHDNGCINNNNNIYHSSNNNDIFLYKYTTQPQGMTIQFPSQSRGSIAS